MTREEWLRIKALAADALALPESERQAWIVTACAGDEALLREVQSLVDASDSASSLFETPPKPIGRVLTLIEASGGDAAVGRRIGAYRVIGEIGRGGMGAAYLAERADDAFQKRVAIKLIKRGMDTDAILRRFRHERQILAGLSHPNIAMLLDPHRENVARLQVPMHDPHVVCVVHRAAYGSEEAKAVADVERLKVGSWTLEVDERQRR